MFAAGVENARSLALGDSGTVFVGTREAGKVYAVIDRDGDNAADDVITLAQGLNTPNGVAFHGGALYVAELTRVLRFDSIETRLRNPPAPTVVLDGLPNDELHGWKMIRFGPDGHLYLSVGAPCNICMPRERFAGTILRARPDGGEVQVFARGVRSSLGFDWHPRTGELWFTDNGRDWLGDNTPPDEVNRAARPGLHFGFPYCFGKAVTDEEFGRQFGCVWFTPPALELDPHVAPLGMRFYTGRTFPEQYRGQLFIAEHGSWNRTEPVGYRITLVRLDGNAPVSYRVFAEGWRGRGDAWGRPVDLLVMPDGALLVSDDRANALYRIAYQP